MLVITILYWYICIHMCSTAVETVLFFIKIYNSLHLWCVFKWTYFSQLEFIVLLCDDGAPEFDGIRMMYAGVVIIWSTLMLCRGSKLCVPDADTSQIFYGLFAIVFYISSSFYAKFIKIVCWMYDVRQQTQVMIFSTWTDCGTKQRCPISN